MMEVIEHNADPKPSSGPVSHWWRQAGCDGRGDPEPHASPPWLRSARNTSCAGFPPVRTTGDSFSSPIRKMLAAELVTVHGPAVALALRLTDVGAKVMDTAITLMVGDALNGRITPNSSGLLVCNGIP
jgi:uncharacterized Zn-binding protein involved in type VI secretion